MGLSPDPEGCPFCGKEPTILAIHEGSDDFIREYLIRCDACGIEMAEEYKRDAIERWNIRPARAEATEAQAQTVESLRREIAHLGDLQNECANMDEEMRAQARRIGELEAAVSWSVDAIDHLADTMLANDYHKRLKKRVAWLRSLLPADTKEPSDDR